MFKHVNGTNVKQSEIKQNNINSGWNQLNETNKQNTRVACMFCHSATVQDSIASPVYCLCRPSVLAWVSSGLSGVLPVPKTWWIGCAELPLDVNECECVCGALQWSDLPFKLSSCFAAPIPEIYQAKAFTEEGTLKETKQQWQDKTKETTLCP